MTQQTPPVIHSAKQEDDIDLGYLLAVIQDSKLLILAVAVITSLLGFAYAQLATPIYQADALLQVESRGGSVGGIDLLPMGQELSSTQTEILRSRMILGQAAVQAGLELQVDPVVLPIVGSALIRKGIGRPDFAEGWASVWGGEFIEVRQMNVPAALMESTFTIRAEEAGVYSLIFDEEVLGQGRVGDMLSLANSGIELLVDALQAPPGAEFLLRRRSDAMMISYLQSRFFASAVGDTGIIRLRMTGPDGTELVRSLDAIADVYLLQNINRQAAEAESRLAFLEDQTPVMLQGLTEAEDVLNNYKATQDSVDLDFETRTLLERMVALERQLNDLAFQESELAQRFTASHPSYQTLQEKKLQLQKELSEVDAEVNRLPSTQREVLRLNRDVVVGQQIYMQMLNNMQELRIAKAGTIGNVRILDRAVQGGMIAPDRVAIVVVSSIAGMFLGLMLVLVRHVLNRGVESVEQLQNAGLQVYAAIPLSDTQAGLLTGGAPSKGSRRKKSNDSAHKILAWLDPADMAIEALRSLRTSLHFAMLDAPNNRLMLAGASPAVGKSFVSVNLAAICGHSGQRVLLIDADLRKGYIHRIFDGKSTEGLSDLLVGTIDMETAIRKTVQPSLDYVARGTIPPNPSELLMNERFNRFLEEASKRYDLVIIDTPPALAVTDAAVVGRQAGSTFMVVRYKKNSPREVERAVQQLESAGVAVKGAILNAIERSALAYYGYGYGYYNYAYKSDTNAD